MTATPYRAEPSQQPMPDAPAAPIEDHYAAFDESQWSATMDEEEPAQAGGRAVLGWALGVLAVLWIAYTAWSAGRDLAGVPVSSPLVAQWVAIAAGPLALLGLAWIMFGRTRRKEAEAFTRSVIAMRTEARSLEGLLSVLRQRIDENNGALRTMSGELMGLGDEAAGRLGNAAQSLDDSARRIRAQGEALDRAAEAARVDMGVLLDDLPRAEATARSMAEALRLAGSDASSQAAEFEAHVQTLTERTRDADTVVGQASRRLVEHLATIEQAGAAAASRTEAVASGSSATIDALLQRSAEALDEIRGGIDMQAAAVTALVAQASAGMGRAGAEAAETLGSRLSAASGSLDSLTARIAEQDRASQRMIADIDTGLASLDTKFGELAASGDQRAVAVAASLARIRDELEGLTNRAGDQDGALAGLAERTTALRSTIDMLSNDVHEQLASAMGEAEAQASRLLAAAQAARPEIELARDAAVEAGTRLDGGAAAIEAQHDRLAALLAAVDTGVGGAERRLTELSDAIARADGEAKNLSAETGPALVAALVQVREAANHAAERAREAIAGVIPHSAGQLSEAARTALEQVVRDTVAEQLREVEAVATRAVDSARAASERLTQQMISIGQSASALEAHLERSQDAQRQQDSEAFAKRVSLLIDSMHSASIDVGKILSDEVDDKAWGSYLKGDRGVFTRRAARLIGGTESRSIAAHYEADGEFHDSVNRYVHDFEAMLRRVMAERDGGPLAVTLMSSDMGKLYAALAPTVERRR